MFDDQSISIPKKTRHMCFDTESIESRESPMKIKIHGWSIIQNPMNGWLNAMQLSQWLSH